jgi:hypothetical protein
MIFAAPPTYAECIGGPVSILDDEDDEAHIFGSTSYTPMYAYVYEHPSYLPPPAYLDATHQTSIDQTESDEAMPGSARSTSSVLMLNRQGREDGLGRPQRQNSEDSISLSDFISTI